MKNISNDDTQKQVDLWQMPSMYDGNIDFLHDFFSQKEIQSFSEHEKKLYHEAYKKGYDVGLKSAQETVLRYQESITTLEQVVKGLSEPVHELTQETTNLVADLVISTVKHLFHDAINTDKEAIVTIIEKAIKKVPMGYAYLHIYLNPADYEAIRDNIDLNNVKFIEDNGLSRGGFRIVTDTSELDASVESRYERAIKALMGISDSDEPK